MIVKLAVAMLAVATTSLSAPQLDDLRSRIWASFSQVDAAQQALPPDRRASGAALKRLYIAQRKPVVAELERIGGSNPLSQRGLQALALVVAWGDPNASQKALALLIRTHGDDDALAPALEAAYGDSTTLDKRALLRGLAATTRSRAVAGSSLYLLAQEVLEDRKRAAKPFARQAALGELRRVEALYKDQSTILLGGGPDHRLGAAAASLLFREERLSPGAILPAMAGRDLDGGPVTNASWAGRYTLVDFWATWCPPCVAAFPKLSDMSRRLGVKLRLVSISADASPQVARAFVRREGAGWDQWFVGPSGAVSPAWANASYPYFLLVGPDRRIIQSAQDVQDIEAAVHRVVP